MKHFHSAPRNIFIERQYTFSKSAKNVFQDGYAEAGWTDPIVALLFIVIIRNKRNYLEGGFMNLCFMRAGYLFFVNQHGMLYHRK